MPFNTTAKLLIYDKQRKEIFYDKLGYKLLVLPNFNKKPTEIKSYMDMWLYLFKHITELNEMPKFLDSRVFGLIFDIGKVANLTASDMKTYESSLKNKRDAESVRITAIQEGMKKGKHAQAVPIARNLKKEGLSLDFIAKATELPIEEIEKLR